MVLFLLVFLPLISFAVTYCVTRKLRRAAHPIPKVVADPRIPTQSQNGKYSKEVSLIFSPAGALAKGAPPTLLLRVSLPFRSNAFLSRELVGDRFLRQLGFSQETESGHADFDRRFHIILEEKESALLWLGKAKIRELLADFSAIPGFDYFRITDDFCEISFSPFVLPAGLSFDDFLRKASENLAFIAHSAQVTLGTKLSTGTQRFSARFESYFRDLNRTLWLVVGFVSAVLYAVLYVSAGRLLFPMDGIILCALWGGASVFALLLIFRAKIRSLQLPSRAFIPYFFLGLHVAFTVGIAGAIWVNSHLDDQPSGRLDVVVADKWIADVAAGVYQIQLKPGRSRFFPFTESVTLDVSENSFAQIQPGHTLAVLKLHPGFFDLPWYELAEMRN